jgi:hypothetical protein
LNPLGEDLATFLLVLFGVGWGEFLLLGLGLSDLILVLLLLLLLRFIFLRRRFNLFRLHDVDEATRDLGELYGRGGVVSRGDKDEGRRLNDEAREEDVEEGPIE